MKPYEKLRAFWRGEEPPYDRPVTHGEEAVAALEARYGVHLPADFRDYVLHLCPSTDDEGEMDRAGAGWWGLDRLRNISDEYKRPLKDADLEVERETAIFFGDYAIWCMAWAICCGPGPNYGRVFVVSSQDRFVAADFADFVDRYMADHHSLL
jgi:hypothetical protein